MLQASGPLCLDSNTNTAGLGLQRINLTGQLNNHIMIPLTKSSIDNFTVLSIRINTHQWTWLSQSENWIQLLLQSTSLHVYFYLSVNVKNYYAQKKYLLFIVLPCGFTMLSVALFVQWCNWKTYLEEKKGRWLLYVQEQKKAIKDILLKYKTSRYYYISSLAKVICKITLSLK